jgi:hypothetical protein
MQALICVDGTACQYPVLGIALLPSDKEDFLGGELAIPGIVSVAQVLHHEGWQLAVMVQEGVELDPHFSAPKRGPGKQRQAEVYHGGVQASAISCLFDRLGSSHYNRFPRVFGPFLIS